MKRRTVIFLFIFAMLLPLMILREFTPANELRYLNIVDDALTNGNFITFYDHGVPYADKPPLYFWFAMLLKKVFGCHSMFLLSALLSLVPAFVTGWIMDRWTEEKLDGEESSAALMMMHSSVMFLAASIVLRMDMLMCMFIVLAMYTFGKMYANKKGAREAKAGEKTHEAKMFKRDRLLLPLYVFLAIFSKGAVGFLAPVICIIVFLISDRELRIGRYLGWRFWAILIVLCALWWTGVYLEGGKSYLNNLLFHQTVDRGVNSFHHKAPFWYYLAGYWWIAAVWSLLCVVLIIKGWRKHYLGGIRIKLMIVTALTILVMLSLVSSKIAIYLLPAIPFFIYAGALLLPYFKDDKLVKGIVAAIAWIFIAIGIASIFKKFIIPEKIAGSIPELWAPFWVILLPMVLGGLLGLKALKDKHTPLAISIISASIFVTIFLGSFSMKEINKTTGVKDGCLEAIKISQEKDSPLLYYDFSAAPNMDYYFKQEGLFIREISKEQLSSFEGILFFKERRLKKDSTLRSVLEGKNYVKLGDNVCYADFSVEKDWNIEEKKTEQ
ncbi:MAG: glycosyltransferase family 39 protein [Bacteroidales bacterium]|nr:glycosyltransferase family 39 protein [Bacteroidales bacterium]MBP5517945.1 glycosyltransferase family 39 protein [Bacteroidales bacterium]